MGRMVMIFGVLAIGVAGAAALGLFGSDEPTETGVGAGMHEEASTQVEVVPGLTGTGTEVPVPSEPVVAAKPEPSSDARPEAEAENIRVDEGIVTVTARVLGDLTVAPGSRVILPTGRVYIEGSIHNEGTIDAQATDLVFDGGSESIEGSLTARRMVFEGGHYRVTGKSQVSTTPRGNADPLQPELIILPGSSLVIEEGAKVVASDPYAFRVEGELIIDGGTFTCSFANGNDKTTAQSWPEGGTLTIHRGLYRGQGDQDFGAARIVIHDGTLLVTDDIWSLGADLTMHGGRIANASYGGAFHVRGRVDMYGGEWLVGQRGNRGLLFTRRSDMRATGGRIVVRGSHVASPPQGARRNGGMYLDGSASLHDLVLSRSTQVDPRSQPGAVLYVAGTLTLAHQVRLHDPDGVVRANQTVVQEPPKAQEQAPALDPGGSRIDLDVPPGRGRVRPPVVPSPGGGG